MLNNYNTEKEAFTAGEKIIMAYYLKKLSSHNGSKENQI